MNGWIRHVSFALAVAFFVVGCSRDHNHAHDQGIYTAEEIQYWEQAAAERMSGKADTAGCSGVTVPDQSGFDKRVVLTFDDGPNPETTPIILDTLKEWGVKATFFINGSRVNSPRAHAVVQRIVDEGHILANHSQNHKNLAQLTLEEVKGEILSTDEFLNEWRVDNKFFRFPFGAANCARTDLARSLGYKVAGWHIDSADWCYANPTGGVGHCDQRTFRWVTDSMRHDMLAYTLSQTRRSNGGILLFHDVHQYTADNLHYIIEALFDEGFQFVNLDHGRAFPKLNQYTEEFAEESWIGTPCTEHWQCDFEEDAYCYTFSSSVQIQGFCSLPCNQDCPFHFFEPTSFCTSLDGGFSGTCVTTPAPRNEYCHNIPGTRAGMAEQFIDAFMVFPEYKEVCLPH